MNARRMNGEDGNCIRFALLITAICIDTPYIIRTIHISEFITCIQCILRLIHPPSALRGHSHQHPHIMLFNAP